jgi:hypothetical protein
VEHPEVQVPRGQVAKVGRQALAARMAHPARIALPGQRPATAAVRVLLTPEVAIVVAQPLAQNGAARRRTVDGATIGAPTTDARTTAEPTTAGGETREPRRDRQERAVLVHVALARGAVLVVAPPNGMSGARRRRPSMSSLVQTSRPFRTASTSACSTALRGQSCAP